MALWDDLIAEVYTLTNRSDLSAETALALRNAIRAAHKSGKYWRDLVTTTLTLSETDTVQEVILSDIAPRFRQAAYLKVPDQDVYYSPVSIDDLIDADGLVRVNVYWGLGTRLKIRGESSLASLELCYYQYPVLTPTSSVDSWICENHRDLVVMWAASTVLGIIGEQEIKARLDALSAIAFSDLQQDNIEIQGR